MDHLFFYIDISPVLLCRSEKLVGDSLTDSSAVIPPDPVCINIKNLQVFKGKPTKSIRFKI